MTRSLLWLTLVVCAAASPAAAQTEPQRRPASDVLDRVSSWSRPEYPKDALDAGVTGDVDVNFTISEGGDLVSAEAIDGPDALRFAALSAMHAWTFRAAEGDEPRGDVWTTLTFEFVDEDGIYFATLQRSPSTIGRTHLPSPDNAPIAVPGPLAGGDIGDPIFPPGTSSGSAAASPAPAAPKPVSARPSLLNRPRPTYSEQARYNHTEGNVIIKVLLGGDRTVKAQKILRGLPDGLDAKAVEAALQLQFEPAKDAAGTPVDAWVTISVNFKIR